MTSKAKDPKARTPILQLNQQIAKLIGANIKQARVARGFTLEELATRAGIRSTTPKSRMWEIESSSRQQGFRLGTIYAIAMALELEVSELLPTVEEVAEVARTVEQVPLPAYLQ